MRSRKMMPTLIIIAIVLIIILFISNLNKNKNVEQQNGTTAGEITTNNVTQAKQGDVEISDVNITSDGTMTNVTAQVTNNGSNTFSMVDISVIFYDSNKAVLSTAKGLIEKLEVGDKKGFSSSITGDFSKSSTYEVKIEQAQ